MELPSQGQIFQKKYKLQEILGRGGFAAVYRATDMEIGRDVAIKMLAPGEDGYESGVASRFMREARVIASLQDPHTITMFDFGKSNEGLLFMVFEYVRGEDLSQLIKKTGPLHPDDAVHILVQLLEALREAHAAGVLHRDIKPANVLVYDYMGDPFSVKLLDFGIAKPVMQGEDAEGMINITRAGALVGTPRYMSPEQIYGGDLTPASDIYSLGLVMHEMLMGRPAIKGSTTKEMILAQLSDDPVRLPPNLTIGGGLRRIVDKMTSREAELRFTSADEVLDALEMVDLSFEYAPPPPASTGPAPSGRMTAYPPHTMGEPTPSSQFAPLDATPQPTLDEQRQQAVSKLAILSLGIILVAAVVIGIVILQSEPDYSRPEQLEPPELGAAVPSVEPSDTLAGTTQTNSNAAAPDAGKKPASPPSADGCGKDPLFIGEKYLQSKVGYEKRFWATHIPKNYDPDTRHPVVMVFHETTKNGSRIINDTRLNDLADEEGFVVIGLDARDPARPWTGEDDHEAIQRAVSETAKLFCLDTKRVYLVGHGAGGRIAERAPCHIRVSAVAVTGYNPDVGDQICAPDPPVPYIKLQGMDDRYAPVKGGSPCTGGTVLSLDEAEEIWRKQNSCSGPERRVLKEENGTCHTWNCEVPFVTCHLDGGHDWPESSPELFELPNCLASPAKFPYGKTIWNFFLEHGRPIGSKPDAEGSTKKKAPAQKSEGADATEKDDEPPTGEAPERKGRTTAKPDGEPKPDDEPVGDGATPTSDPE